MYSKNDLVPRYTRLPGKVLRISKALTIYLSPRQRILKTSIGPSAFNTCSYPLLTGTLSSYIFNFCRHLINHSLIMDSTWSLLGTATSQSALNSSMNSTWSLIGTGAPFSPFNSSMNSTWSLIGTAGSSSLFTVPTSGSQLLNSTWSSDSQATAGPSSTSSWAASFSTVIISETESSIDLASGNVTTSVVVTSSPTSTMDDSTPYVKIPEACTESSGIWREMSFQAVADILKGP